MPATVYLISGSNRGIGLGMVKYIIETHDDAFVYAGVRDANTASSLRELESKYPSKISIVQCVSADREGNAALAKQIEERHRHVDFVIANAAICHFVGFVHQVDIADMEDHFHVNVMGPIVLFQAVYHLLRKSSNPHFIPVTSIAGKVSDGFIKSPIGTVSYGATKAALNWVARKIHFENEWIVCFPLSPGGVDTDMVQNSFVEDPTGVFEKVVDGNMIPVDEAAPMLVQLIDNSTRGNEGGQYVDRDGTRVEQWL